MDVADAPMIVEPAKGPIQSRPQPIEQLSGITQTLDDAAVRAAVVAAEAAGIDPLSLTIGDMAKGPETPAAQAPAPARIPEVPSKFLKPDGAVDVEKIQASTRQLDEAIQTKEQALQKTVDDYLQAEAKFRNLPNPQRLAQNAPPAPAVPMQEQPQLTPQQLQARLDADLRADLPGTVANLVDAIVEHRLKAAVQPLQQDIEATRQERMNNERRANLQAIAEKDPRILNQQVFDAINAKLTAEPELWKLKNPHKAAWLEVKDELRLGDPTPGQALPSRPSPVLGGGTPPSAPPSANPQSQDILANLHRLDLRDRKQEAMGDEAVRAALARSNRW